MAAKETAGKALPSTFVPLWHTFALAAPEFQLTKRCALCKDCVSRTAPPAAGAHSPSQRQIESTYWSTLACRALPTLVPVQVSW